MLCQNTGSAPEHAPNLYEPVANPKAEVIAGHARFTVLTPQLIRMEWSADGKFEDHASLVFLNRSLPVPQFNTTKTDTGLTLKTAALDRFFPLGYDSNEIVAKLRGFEILDEE